MSGRTLVVHTGGIGDFIVTCPAIAQLGGAIELLGRPDRLALAVEAGIAESAYDIEASDFHTLLSTPSEPLVEFLRRFDRVVVWMRDEDERIQRALRSIGIGRVDLFPGIPEDGWNRHASEYYAQCLGVSIDPEFRLNIAPSETHQDVILHPGSGSPVKNWPSENFHALDAGLNKGGYAVGWCMGPAELERENPGMEYAPLTTLARTFGNTGVYVGNDSGMTHLAAAVGCPTVAIFGPTDPAVWAPRGEHVTIVRGEPWPSLAEVAQACLGWLV